MKEPIIDSEKRLRCAFKGFGDLKRQYREPDAMVADIAAVLGEMERLRELAEFRRRRINEMRNAFPEMLVAMGDLQKKYSFTFRDEREGATGQSTL